MWKPYNRTWHKVNVIMILLLLYWGLVRSLASQGLSQLAFTPLPLWRLISQMPRFPPAFHVSILSLPPPLTWKQMTSWPFLLFCEDSNYIKSLVNSLINVEIIWNVTYGGLRLKVQDLRKKLPIIFPRKDKETLLIPRRRPVCEHPCWLGSPSCSPGCSHALPTGKSACVFSELVPRESSADCICKTAFS